MNRDYASTDQHEGLFSALDETGQDLGYGLGIGQDYIGSSEINNGHHHSDSVPLISPGHQVLSPEPYEQFRRYRGASVTSPAELLPEQDRHASQNDDGHSKKRNTVDSRYSLQNLRNIYSPDFHKHANDKKRPYAKMYDFRRTRDKLLRTSLLQWLVTIGIAASIVGVLLAYQRKQTIDRAQKHVFNALITGLAISLGINLASSLRSYADLLRWRLLTCSWLSLEEFDLILSCSSQRKIFQLMLMTSGRRKFPFVSWIQFSCAMWITVNVAAQIVVAMLGLVYGLDNSTLNIVSMGPTSIADLRVVRNSDDVANETLSGQHFSAHAYGIQGENFPLVSINDPLEESQNRVETVFTDAAYSYMIYRFTDYNPTDNTTYHSSERTVNVTAKCDSYVSTNSSAAFSPDGDQQLPGGLFYYTDKYNHYVSLYVRDYMSGSVTYVAEDYLYCGARCARVFAFQAAQVVSGNEELIIPQNRIFDCNNTVGEIANATVDGRQYVLPGGNPARSIAGAIAWTGYVSSEGDGKFEHHEYQLFSNTSYWSPQTPLRPTGRFSAARYISQYSIAALAAMDSNGPKVVINDGRQPQQALVLSVEWGNAGILLSIIIGIQLIFLLLVVFWANKAVIKDDSFLAIAKLLAPTVMTLGEHGSVLRGDEIAHAIDQQKGGNYKIFYGPREARDDEEAGSGSSQTGQRPISRLSAPSIGSTMYRADTALRAGIIERGMGVYPNVKEPFVDGKYD